MSFIHPQREEEVWKPPQNKQRLGDVIERVLYASCAAAIKQLAQFTGYHSRHMLSSRWGRETGRAGDQGVIKQTPLSAHTGQNCLNANPKCFIKGTLDA